jgi:hypothetical protein
MIPHPLFIARLFVVITAKAVIQSPYFGVSFGDITLVLALS